MTLPPYPLSNDQHTTLSDLHANAKRVLLQASIGLMLWIPASLLIGLLLTSSIPSLMCIFLGGVGAFVVVIAQWSMKYRDYSQDLADGVMAVYEGPVSIQVVQGRYGKRYYAKHEGGRMITVDYETAQRILEAANAVPPIPYRVTYAPHSGTPFGLEPLGDLPSAGEPRDAAPDA